jgi:hypothetical protein
MWRHGVKVFDFLGCTSGTRRADREIQGMCACDWQSDVCRVTSSKQKAGLSFLASLEQLEIFMHHMADFALF